MRVVVTGDRLWNNSVPIYNALRFLPKDTTIVHGGAQGADSLVAHWAPKLGFQVEMFQADWKKHGRSAGPIRNIEMLKTKPDLVIAFHWNLHASKGTKHCVLEAQKRGIPVVLIGAW